MSKGKLRAIKQRIESTESTMQITKAMQMVATAKLKKVERGLPPIKEYEKRIFNTLKVVHNSLEYPPSNNGEGEVLIIITADMGLCGAFNSEIIRYAHKYVEQNNIKGIITVGIKAEKAFSMHKAFSKAFSRYYDTPDLDEVAVIWDEAYEKLREVNASSLKVIYAKLKNILVQLPETKTIFPLDVEDESKENYDFEPSPEEIYDDLLNSWGISVLLSTAYETKLGELYSRQNAMKNATDNAVDLIEKLTLEKNKVRQSTITREIIEIVNGAEALEG
ncbi:MAG: ATP synthase F1 subunit gamma [Kosmotoga sp.]|nr:MAG: ATP synthase F1 subunit gamma [Kosmotoga sp.]